MGGSYLFITYSDLSISGYIVSLVIEKLIIIFFIPWFDVAQINPTDFSTIQNSTRDYVDSTDHKSQTETEYFKMIA